MPDISFENVSYVPLLPADGVGLGRHSGMILPNSSIDDHKDEQIDIIYDEKRKLLQEQRRWQR